jgi:ubiquinone/menaquinone biosynthesis C-methylase UbiE
VTAPQPRLDAGVVPVPQAHASAAEVEAAWRDPKLANVLYHDWEAGTYDDKWSISFDERCIAYARDRFEHVAGPTATPYPTSLELGCGTGFFTLNLKLAGILDQAWVTDLSPGMVQVAERNAASLGFEISGRVADAEQLPFDDDSFDLVIGHAVLHHIPDLDLTMREVLRVLKPGGRFVFAGEPTKVGDFYARKLGQFTWFLTTRVTKLSALSSWRRPQEKLTVRWRLFAYHLWLRLSALDKKVLSKVLPRELFYNVMITGTKRPS